MIPKSNSFGDVVHNFAFDRTQMTISPARHFHRCDADPNSFFQIDLMAQVCGLRSGQLRGVIFVWFGAVQIISKDDTYPRPMIGRSQGAIKHPRICAKLEMELMLYKSQVRKLGTNMKIITSLLLGSGTPVMNNGRTQLEVLLLCSIEVSAAS
jgi:hypothetical protein